MSNEYEKELCKTVLKCGPNAGLFCLRTNCRLKNHGNIASYLKLPKEIVNETEKYKKMFDYNKLVSIFEKCSAEKDLKDLDNLGNIIDYVFSLPDIENKKMKFVVFIYIYIIFDTPLMRLYLNTYFKDFYLIANYKIREFSTCSNPKYKIFVSYIKETFVENQLFFCRKKNLKYSFNKLVVYLKCANRLNNLYYKILDKRYAVGGAGYLEAKDEFYSLC